MKDTLADIRKKLQDGVFKNEEHVRFALVGRLLEKLGWDIWNPRQVYAEFVPVPTEDNKAVDLALFTKSDLPAVFIEVKAVRNVRVKLEETETQLRNYNRDITALFGVITDGIEWRFYYSKSQGSFPSKCFKIVNLLSDDLEDAEVALCAFLGKEAIENENAEKEAQGLMRLSRNRKAMEECLPRARQMTHEPPYPSLPDALCDLARAKDHAVTRKEAEGFIVRAQDHGLVGGSFEAEKCGKHDHEDKLGRGNGIVSLQPERPDSLTHTSIDSARFGNETADNWNALVCVGIRIAAKKGCTIVDFRKWLNAQVEEGSVTDRGFHPVAGTRFSFQYMEANRAWENALALAKQLKCEIAVEFHWLGKSAAAHPGKSGALRWAP